MHGKTISLALSLLWVSITILIIFTSIQTAEELKNGKPLWIYETDEEVYDVDISLEGNYLIAISDKLYLFSKNSSEPLWTNLDSRPPIAISDNGKYIVSDGYFEETPCIFFFSREKGIPLWHFPTLDNIYTVAISSNGDYVVAGSYMGVIYFFENKPINLSEQIQLPIINLPKWIYKANDTILALDISSNGDYIVVGTDKNDGRLYLFSKENNIPLWSYDNQGLVNAVCISSNGEYISANIDRDVGFFSKDSNVPLWKKYSTSSIESISISSDGEYIAVSNWGNVCFFSKNSELVQKFPTHYYVVDVDISSDGQFIAACDDSDIINKTGYIYFFSRNKNITSWTYKITSSFYAPIAISGSGEYVVGGSYDGRVYLFFNEDIGKDFSNNDNDLKFLFYKGIIIILMAVGVCVILFFIKRKKLRKCFSSNLPPKNPENKKN